MDRQQIIRDERTKDIKRGRKTEMANSKIRVTNKQTNEKRQFMYWVSRKNVPLSHRNVPQNLFF